MVVSTPAIGTITWSAVHSRMFSEMGKFYYIVTFNAVTQVWSVGSHLRYLIPCILQWPKWPPFVFLVKKQPWFIFLGFSSKIFPTLLIMVITSLSIAKAHAHARDSIFLIHIFWTLLDIPLHHSGIWHSLSCSPHTVPDGMNWQSLQQSPEAQTAPRFRM
jgi:hypothetical protein